MDLYELVCGMKGVPSDESQRLGIMCLREDRITGRIRYVAHMPTANMLADGLTKPGIFENLLHFCTTGVWIVYKTEMRPVRLKLSARRRTYTERDLMSMKD